jgi:predicted deacylase
LNTKPAWQRLGKNITGYFGESIDISAVLADCVTTARLHGWSVEDISPPLRPNLVTLRRPATTPGAHVYISAGIHGDEPAGPIAVQQLLHENRWPSDLWLSICPCLNPSGFVANRRENSDGLDLNRDYLQPKAAETIAHMSWLEQQPRFDLCLCLHEDWESHGFYVYELNPDLRPSIAEAIVRAVGEVCPIDRSEMIEGRTARDGIIRPSIDPSDRPQWPEAFFLLTYKTRLSCTLEAPSDFALSVRVAALVTGVRAALAVLTA